MKYLGWSHATKRFLRGILDSQWLSNFLAILGLIIAISVFSTEFIRHEQTTAIVVTAIAGVLIVMIGVFSNLFVYTLNGFIKKAGVGSVRRVFLAYAQAQEDFARALVDQLRAQGDMVWVAVENIHPGDAILPAIRQAVDAADMVVVLIGETLGDWTEHEIKIAKEKGVRIVPVLLEEGSEIPMSIAGLNYIDETGKSPQDMAEDVTFKIMYI